MRYLAATLFLAACTTTGTLDIDAPAERVDTVTDGEPWVIVADARVEDAGHDGVYDPGEAIVLPWTLVNVRGDDFMGYPGVVVETSDSRVVVEDFWLYGIFGRTTNGYESTVTSTAPSGTEVEFTVRATTLACERPDDGMDCEFADEVHFTVTMP